MTRVITVEFVFLLQAKQFGEKKKELDARERRRKELAQNQVLKTYNNNNNLLISSAQVSTIRFSNACYRVQNNLNMCTI